MSEDSILEQFDARERRILRSLSTPVRIQRFLDDEIRYNLEPGVDTCHSPRTVLRKGVAHCMEGAMLAAVALRLLGHPPLVVDLEAERDSDHVLAVYRANGHWGALAKSDYSGLRSREPVYRSIRELVMSYFEHYFNAEGEKSLRAFSRPISLRQFDKQGWMTSEEDVWMVPNYLCEIKHTPLFTKAMLRRIEPMDKRLFAACRLGGLHPNGAH
jgi:hypothetical protein